MPTNPCVLPSSRIIHGNNCVVVDYISQLSQYLHEALCLVLANGTKQKECVTLLSASWMQNMIKASEMMHVPRG